MCETDSMRNRKPEHRQKRALAKLAKMTAQVQNPAWLDRLLDGMAPAKRAEALRLMRPNLAPHLKEYV